MATVWEFKVKYHLVKSHVLARAVHPLQEDNLLWSRAMPWPSESSPPSPRARGQPTMVKSHDLAGAVHPLPEPEDNLLWSRVHGLERVLHPIPEPEDNLLWARDMASRQPSNIYLSQMTTDHHFHVSLNYMYYITPMGNSIAVDNGKSRIWRQRQPIQMTDCYLHSLFRNDHVHHYTNAL